MKPGALANAAGREKRRNAGLPALLFALALGAASLTSTVAPVRAQQQFPLADRVADKVIANYQNSSCQQLAAKKAQPPTAMQQRVVQFLQQDPTLRAHFIDRVAAPIANKLFECGFIP